MEKHKIMKKNKEGTNKVVKNVEKEEKEKEENQKQEEDSIMKPKVAEVEMKL